jgi:predicted metal-dependent hydrolase
MINKIPTIETVNKYWLDNNASLTHFMSALSVLFPKGELFFMKSLAAYIKDYPEVKKDLIQFNFQERNHTIAHLKLNNLLDENNLLKNLEEETEQIIKRYTKYTTKKQKLIITLCLEHITALLADYILQDKCLQSKMKSDAKNVWIYHAMEEASESHRELASKIYKLTGGSKLYVKIIMIPVTIMLSKIIGQNWYKIYNNDSTNPHNLVADLQALETVFGLHGLVGNITPHYLKFFTS